MRSITFARSIALVLFSTLLSAPGIAQTNAQLIANLKAHIQYLADDKLEGRRTGTKGEELARTYIADQFKKAGIQPKGSEGYFQPFLVIDGKEMVEACQVSINGEVLKPNEDFFVYPFSGNKTLESGFSTGSNENGKPWAISLDKIVEENKSNFHYDLSTEMKNIINQGVAGGATAIIFYSLTKDEQKFDPKDRTEASSLPIIYIGSKAAKKFLADASRTVEIRMTTGIAQKSRTGYNVIGYIDNGAATTVVLGAHYDHLGFGEDGNSMHRTGEKSIHNGADDNASGTAALIELAGLLNKSKAKKNNYLFVAFSGEELGLYGSKYFTENPTIQIPQVNYMINMDMVGRLNDSSRSLTIGGFGTSPSWSGIILKEYFETPNSNKKTAPSLNIRIDSSGTGPSDHTSFYRKDIPVLFYFTGLHTDYHKPTDDANKINYEGTRLIIRHIQQLVESMNESPRLAFTKTREAQATTSARFSVSLGIMPDYTYSGAGVRADGVTEGRAAHKAGLKTGDIVTQLGDYPVNSMESYMQALGKFKKGDRTFVKFKRGTESLEAAVEF